MTSLTSGAVTGSVRLWLRLEALAVFALAVYLYARGGYSWLIFSALFLAPDLSFAAYLAGSRVGAAGYNILHSYIGPVALAAAFLATDHPPILGLIWAAHIGFDRLLGYGLKYPTEFGDTHLGAVGRRRAPRPAA